MKKESRRLIYLYCAIPLIAGLMVNVFLIPQTASDSWRLRAGDGEAMQLGRLLQEQEALSARFAEALRTERANYTVEDWRRVVGASGIITWRFLSGLYLAGILCGFFIAGFIIRYSLRCHLIERRWFHLGWLFLVCCAVTAVLSFVFGVLWKSTVVFRQFMGHIETQLGGSQLVGIEIVLIFLGYVMAFYLFCASGATLLPYCPWDAGAGPRSKAEIERHAVYYADQMRHLRLILYVGAVVLAVTVLRARANLKWALDYLPPLAVFAEKSAELLTAKLMYERLESFVTNTVTSVGVMNTLILAALYVPAALILQMRAGDLAEEALVAEPQEPAPEEPEERKAGAATQEPGVEPKKKAPDREEWLKSRGLSFPLKENLGRIAAILSPLLAGPVSDLLLFLKG
jgi:hypothetical protein